ncbi:phosphatase [Bacillus nakamurai]|uniref:Phosphatase n=1 Tax=Bacillus nakamurai TaxID=1793963 RepID=A0A150FBD7_9BACI|nr:MULTISPECIES: PhrK family phosphatase-inhibitory pheromone [Bacillus]MBT2714083.1 PhrK family phosphatase-inhibitory pheromone [Pseudomonas sp. ISL-88]KXZ15071.1 phosphatase [Bacillus nakamurai]KXZ22454.1 phosphatase [Bacillus nakamurai]MBT2575193.1 PhrK family phosphatase-inhibitory pheromone [Bacillus sp. ISL-51]MBT2633488.1 PhrK family phosphatase-inhibitory pheromone [Bacillus sp. ISL-26]
MKKFVLCVSILTILVSGAALLQQSSNSPSNIQVAERPVGG